MRYPRILLCIAGAGAFLLNACTPPPENVRVKERVSAPPDLVRAGATNPANQAYQLRAFHLNHVWADRGSGADAADSFRSKISVWDYENETAPVAELYFHDSRQESLPASSDPAHASRPYQIHFPLGTFEPILNTLRNTNEPIFLYYFDGRWAVGIYSAEPVGSG